MVDAVEKFIYLMHFSQKKIREMLMEVQPVVVFHQISLKMLHRILVKVGHRVHKIRTRGKVKNNKNKKMMKAVSYRSQSPNSPVFQNRTLLNPFPLHPFLQASILDLDPHCHHRFLTQLKLSLYHNSRQEHGVQEV